MAAFLRDNGVGHIIGAPTKSTSRPTVRAMWADEKAAAARREAIRGGMRSRRVLTDDEVRRARAMYDSRQTIGIQRVILATVLAYADLPYARRVQHHRLLAPAVKYVVHVPTLATRLERYVRRRRCGPESLLELTQPTNRRARYDHAAGDLASTRYGAPPSPILRFA